MATQLAQLASPAALACSNGSFRLPGRRPAAAIFPSGENRPARAGPVAAKVAAESRKRFVELVKSNHGRVLRLALGMLRDRDLAEDVAQETFVRAFRFYQSFRNDAAFFTWLYRIAVNLCIDVQRKQGRVERLSEDDEEPQQPDPAPTPERALEVRELARHAEAALDTLSPNHRAILLLREVEGLSYEEIARVLRIPRGTVMSRLFHARANLQRAAQALAG